MDSSNARQCWLEIDKRDLSPAVNLSRLLLLMMITMSVRACVRMWVCVCVGPPPVARAILDEACVAADARIFIRKYKFSSFT